jgi:hypothetical protein
MRIADAIAALVAAAAASKTYVRDVPEFAQLLATAHTSPAEAIVAIAEALSARPDAGDRASGALATAAQELMKREVIAWPEGAAADLMRLEAHLGSGRHIERHLLALFHRDGVTLSDRTWIARHEYGYRQLAERFPQVLPHPLDSWSKVVHEEAQALADAAEWARLFAVLADHDIPFSDKPGLPEALLDEPTAGRRKVILRWLTDLAPPAEPTWPKHMRAGAIGEQRQNAHIVDGLVVLVSKKKGNADILAHVGAQTFRCVDGHTAWLPRIGYRVLRILARHKATTELAHLAETLPWPRAAAFARALLAG